MIKTFRGLIADGGQDTIVLHTNDGSTGYRIKKFQTISTFPGSADVELITKIYKVKQASITGGIDFSDNKLLGVAYYADGNTNTEIAHTIILFDNEIFNQDIYVTSKEQSGTGAAINYYLELEQVKLDLNESTVATLKDIRNLS